MAISNVDRQARFRVRQNGLKLRVSVREADVLLRLLKDTPYGSLRDKIDEQATKQLRESFTEYMERLNEQDELMYDIVIEEA
jgi:hypothetical protein